MTDNNNKIIDELLRKRQNAMMDFSQSTNDLLSMGIKIVEAEDGLELPSSYEHYLDKYTISGLEFEWEVEYEDGKKIGQFEGLTQHHFGHIDQSKIKTISFISNFDWPTDSIDKRVIVRLNWENGLFNFINGFASQEVKEEMCVYPYAGPKKLVLFARKRETSSVGDPGGIAKQYFDAAGEQFIYNRFVLGFEYQGKIKAVIIEPNGNINIFQK